MYSKKRFVGLLILILGLVLVGNAPAAQYEGTIKAGYRSLDTEGNLGVNQSSYNLFEGGTLHLEKFWYQFNNGINLNADMRDVLNNGRNINLSLTKPGHGGLSFRHNAYRRNYGNNPTVETRRKQTSGQLWWQAHRWFKLFGGAGMTTKKGQSFELHDFGDLNNSIGVDYSHLYYNAGLTFRRDRTTATVEYRGSDFSDDLDNINDRATQRIRATALTPLPYYNNIVLNGGYQFYRNTLENREDTVEANTYWAGARFTYKGGWSLRYSLIFDRASRTGDLVETDNITHAVYAGKTFRGKGGLTVGYQKRYKDDVFDELSGSSLVLTGWARLMTGLTYRVGYGSNELDVDAGRTLTGKTERTRHWTALKYRKDNNWAQVRYDSRKTENEDIGSTADYNRIALDAMINVPGYADLSGSYSYSKGKYENDAGLFDYNEHVISGDVTSVAFHGAQGGFGGTYYRSKEDLDVEAFTVRIMGRYHIKSNYGIEVEYQSHNFDNLADTSPVYTEYYTDNVVEVNLFYEL